jgi:hypothetical protein
LVAGYLEYHPGPLTILQIAKGIGLEWGTVSQGDKGHIAVLAKKAGWKRHGRWSLRTFTRPGTAPARR